MIAKGPVLCVAPHPDDEILGPGGSLARFRSVRLPVYVAVVTRGEPPLFDVESEEELRKETIRCHEELGVSETFFLDLPAARLDSLEHHVLNAVLAEVITKVRPATVLLPFEGDIHLDHKLVFRSAMVAVRPSVAPFVQEVLCYETLSETNWGHPATDGSFEPTMFVDISAFLPKKLELLKYYHSQLQDFPHERSLEAIRSLAQLRGASVGVSAAEGFVQIRRTV